MPSVYLTADPHFSHAGICRFTYIDAETGEEKKVRPFTDPQEMNEFMIKAWNETVKPVDKVYVLGDVAMKDQYWHDVLPRLNGDLVLIAGNHDMAKPNVKNKYFRDVRACHVMNGCILTHIPIHKASMARFGCNIHGHLHQNSVKKARGVNAKTGEILYSNEIDPDYICVSVEHTGFKPILFEDVLKRIVKQGGQVGFRSTGERFM